MRGSTPLASTMQKVKILATGEIKEVTSNIAHGLIDRGEAVLHTGIRGHLMHLLRQRCLECLCGSGSQSLYGLLCYG